MTDAVSSARFPYRRIQVQIGSPQQVQQELSVEALVATGFDGGVLLPMTMIDPAIAPDTHLPWLLADGTEVLTPTYLATVQVGTLDPS